MKIRWQAILVGLSMSVIVYLISFHLIFLNGLERSFYDFRFFFREDHSTPERYHENPFTSPTRQRVIEVKGGEMVAEERWNQYEAVVVKIDDETLEAFGEWPFPRDVHAQMLKSAREAGSKATLFDVLFIVPQKVPAAITLATKDNPSLYAQMQRIYAGMDSTLAREIERSGNVYLDLSVAYQENKDPGFQARISEMEDILQRHYLPIGDYNKRQLKFGYMGYQPLLTQYARASKGTGLINVDTKIEENPAEDDEVIRQFPLVYPMQNGKFLPGNVLLMAMDYYGATKNDLTIKIGEYIKIKSPAKGVKTIPIDSRGRVLINFSGKETIFYKGKAQHAVRSVSYRDVVQKKPDVMSEIKDKYLFVGAFSFGMANDVHLTPYDKMFGISVMANTFNTIITEQFIHPSPHMLNVILIFAIGILMSLVLSFSGIRLSAIVAVVAFIAVAAASVLLFTTNNYALKTVPLLLNILLTFIAIMVYRALTEEKDKQFLKQTFSSYLAPELIDIMYESKQMPKLGGESRVNTAFFTDIQGFSTFSEKLTATQVVELLNEYLGSMTDILLAERGTLDKYIGDAIIGIFGAPMALPDHALRACKVAIGMQANLGRLREKWAAEKADASEPNRNSKNLPPEEWEPGAKWPRIVWDMRVRVGINSGEMVTGNMGSTMRMNYTMMGDTVNLAARLEAGAKQFGVYTLVAEDTLNISWQDETGTHVVKDMVESRFIDRITVVGKTAPVEVYEVISLKGELTAEQQELFKLFAEGVKYYQNTEWDKALAVFTKTQAMELFPKNKYTPSKMYIERCETFKENPPVKPGEKWDGVFRMTQKH